MRHFFITVIGTIIGLFIAVFLLFFLLIGLGVAMAPNEQTDNNVVLQLDLTSGLKDQSSGGDIFGSEPEAVINIVRKLNQAKTDDTVSGLFIRANSYTMPPAQAEEINMAIADFKTSGKFVIAHAQGFEGTSLSHYIAVSAASEIWLQDTAGFSIAGYRAETPFYGGVFEKYDAEAEFEQFKEYKTAANTYTQTGYTEAHRESTTAMLRSLFESGTTLIAANRDMSKTDVTTVFERAPLSAEAALEAGMVDTLGHYAAAREHALDMAGDDAKFKSVKAYSFKAKRGPVIALVGGQGAIMTGNSTGNSPFSAATTMGSDTIAKAITAAAEDDAVKAIILRVDSPGGSAIASDQMWDAVVRAKDAGKPVVVSMAQYAASGGYYVAAPADKIIALPMTLTGSIGVLGGKVALDKTFDKIGYNVEAISVGGEYTAAYSQVEPWNQRNRAAFRRSMEDIYDDFTSKVASGRGLPLGRVLEIAKGRVWTGEQALEVGLVDELGGFMSALASAKALGDIGADETVRIRTFPRAKTTAEQLQELFGSTVSAGATLEQLSTLASSPEVQALIAAQAQLTRSPSDAALMATMPNLP